ncbi:DEAD/DEAH box helicase [uncultured Treponema sp.]|uniref:DEAD/DEAH box helicase n=1 Tax=uncultured Treponema sp. TaxID=162155 RepID=UPI0025EEC9BD|nr:DEAD/DEAH box helicase [uncultured Treponema sp.]
MRAYSSLNLHEKIQSGLSDAGYVTCTPVQEKVLENSLDGSDLYVQSQTGTGKTAAFLLTIMQEIMNERDSASDGEKISKKNALILVPTRELAVQVEDEARKLGKYTGLKFASFYGGVGYEKQVADLKKGVDIIIGTPGRVIDLTESNQMNLSNVAYLAIDEADRMFDMGFYPDLRKLIHFLPKNEGESKCRQTMLFSATLNSYVKNLAWEYTRDAKEITIEAENITVDEIDQELIHVSSDDKMKLLLGIFKKESPESVIIFCDTKKMCEIVSKRLEINGVKNEYIIGDLPQSKRLKIMDAFKAGKVNCLVATDVAARGIDVNDLAMVVNYDLPSEAENYVHRIGRTARAGKSGKAYTFCSERDVYSLAPIERYIEKQIPSRVAVSEDFEEDKSKDVYIRLDSEEKRDGRRGDKSDRNRRDRTSRNSSREERRSKRGEKSHSSEDFKSFKGDKSKNTVRRASDEEIAKLSGMSSDERLKYFKEKYAKPSSSVYKSEKSKAGKSKGMGSGRKAPHAKKTETPPKKLGLIARLKSLIGRGK